MSAAMNPFTVLVKDSEGDVGFVRVLASEEGHAVASALAKPIVLQAEDEGLSRAGCPLKLACQQVCRDPRGLRPDHHHPDPSPLGRAMAALSPHDVALWASLMAGSLLKAGDRYDPELAALVRDLRGVTEPFVKNRYDTALARLTGLFGEARLERAQAVDAALVAGDLEMAS